jgi:hypothetical protein
MQRPYKTLMLFVEAIQLVGPGEGIIEEDLSKADSLVLNYDIACHVNTHQFVCTCQRLPRYRWWGFTWRWAATTLWMVSEGYYSEDGGVSYRWM